MPIELTPQECGVLRRHGKDPDLIASACHKRPKWLDDLMTEHCPTCHHHQHDGQRCTAFHYKPESHYHQGLFLDTMWADRMCGCGAVDELLDKYGEFVAALRDGPCECSCDGCVHDDHCDRASCAQPA